ncbi:MAG TPA: TRAP transporter TatT component family protein [Pyrinomonadaceae bacterium]|nr:TRAP transporter TatT component family protein [Pyrinomonadaceae bacterium]
MTIQLSLHGRRFREKRPEINHITLVVLTLLLVSMSGGCGKPKPETPQGVDVGDAGAAAAKVAEADKLYDGRENLDKVRQAVALLRQARIEDYGSFEAAWKLARAAYYLGDHTADEHEREISFREGSEAGKAAVRLQDSKPEGHFWLGANYGGAAKYSTLAGLSSVEDIRNEMETVLKIDEGFQSGSAYMVLGQLYLQAPRVLGGDVDKAIDYLQKGLKFGQENALLRLRLAEAYHAAKKNGESKKQIDYILSMKVDPAYAAEYKEAQEQAQKLAGELK